MNMVSPNTKSNGGNTTSSTSPNGESFYEMPTLSLKLANDLILEMDNFIKADLAMLEKFYTQDYKDVPFERAINKAKRKFEKRRGPTLIKPLNKTKKRMIVGDMEYDPKTQSWRGNEGDLAGFPNPPALITNMGMGKVADERVLGSMKWDPNQKEWKGNERDLTKFRFLKPALISQLTPNLESRVENGMVYNPKTMRWEGNEDALDAFDFMDDQNNDNTFSVGKEFNLSPSLIQSFKNSAEEHDRTLGGWFQHRDLSDKEYLFTIRSMSIMKIVRSASLKSGLSPNSSSNQLMSSTSGVNNGQLGSPGGLMSLLPQNKKKAVVDETKDWDDIDFQQKPALKLNLKIHLDAEDELMNDASGWGDAKGFTSEEETLSSNNETGGQFSSSSQPHTPRKGQMVEEWSDFDNTMNSTITGKIIQLNKKEMSQSSLQNQTSNNSLNSLLLSGSTGGTNKFKEQHDDDDDDFDWSNFDDNKNSLNNNQLNNTGGSIGSLGGTITNLNKNVKKGGSLKNISSGTSSTRSKKGDKGSKSRGGTFNIQSFASALSGSGGNINTPLSSSGSTIAGGNANEFYDEFQLPNGGVLSLKNRPHEDNFDLFENDDNQRHHSHSPTSSNKATFSKDEPCDETMKFFEDDKEVFEEDWPEIRLPADFGQKKNQESRKSPPIRNNFGQVEDYSDELDIPQLNQPLKLKSHQLIDNPFGDDDDDLKNLNDDKDNDTWDDISFPENPSQLISSTSKLQKPIPQQPINNINNNNNNNNNNSNITNITNLNNIKPNTTTTTTTTSSINNINSLNNIQTPSKNINNINQTPSKIHTPITFRPMYTPKTIDEILKTPEKDNNSPLNSPFKVTDLKK